SQFGGQSIVHPMARPALQSGGLRLHRYLRFSMARSRAASVRRWQFIGDRFELTTYRERLSCRCGSGEGARRPTSVEGKGLKRTATAAGSRSSFGARGGLEILLEKVVEKCSDHRDRAELAEISPCRGDNAANDVGCQLEFETEQQPHPEA